MSVMAIFKYFQLCVVHFTLHCLCLSAVSCDESGKEQLLSTWKDTEDSSKESQTTEDAIDLLNKWLTLAPDPDIIDVTIKDRENIDYLLQKRHDHSIVYVYIGIFLFIFAIGGFLYLKSYIENRSGNSRVVVEFRNPVTDSSNSSGASDQPPLYDAVVQGVSYGNIEFPTVKPSELETPPPLYDDHIMKIL